MRNFGYYLSLSYIPCRIELKDLDVIQHSMASHGRKNLKVCTVGKVAKDYFHGCAYSGLEQPELLDVFCTIHRLSTVLLGARFTSHGSQKPLSDFADVYTEMS